MMIQKETRIINDREVHLFFDTEQQAYLLSRDLMELVLNEMQELKRYEDADGKGRLFKLPCKVGDYVYQIDRMNNKIHTHKVARINIALGKQSCIMYFDFETSGHCLHTDFGKTVFMNKVDAMNALNSKTEVKK